MEGVFAGKRGLVLGCANRRSIAWAIAKRLADAGAELAFTYQGERIEKNVRDLAGSKKLPGVGEGPLTKARAKLVNRRTLAEHGRRLGLGEHLILSRGEAQHGGREHPSALVLPVTEGL